MRCPGRVQAMSWTCPTSCQFGAFLDVLLKLEGHCQLRCIPYYYNYLHNEHGHGPNSVAHMAEDRLDITQITKDEFLDWCYMNYSPNNPKTHVELDSEVQRASWRRRHPDSPLNGQEPGTRRGGNGRTSTNTTTVSTSTPKPNTLKKALTNYQAITDDSQFEAWSLDFKTTAIAEGTNNVLDARATYRLVTGRRETTSTRGTVTISSMCYPDMGKHPQ